MTTQNNSKYTFLTYLFVLLALFVIFLFTKNVYLSLGETKEQLHALDGKIEAQNQVYNNLQDISQKLNSGEVDKKYYDKFLSPFSEDELLSYFYGYANPRQGKVMISSITFTPGKNNEVGFMEAGVDIEATFGSEKDLMDMVNFLLNSTKYNLFIHEFSYPLGDTNGEVSVHIPLKVIYK